MKRASGGSIGYLTKEGFKNVWLNRLMSVASISVLLSCLVMMGIAFMLVVNMEKIITNIEDSNVIVAFVDDDASDETVSQVRTDLMKIENVKDCEFVSKEEAFEEQLEALGGDRTLFEGMENPLPDSYRVILDDLTQFDSTLRQIKNVDSVQSVREDRELSQQVASIRKTVTYISVGVIIILLIEAGPTTVLREVLYELDSLEDDELIRNIRRRFGGMLTGPIAEIENSDELTDMAIELLGNRYIKNAKSEELRKYNRELIAKAKAQLILSAIAKAEESDESFKTDCFHTDNIQQYIVLLGASKNDTAEKKCELVERSLSDTLLRLICFYKGIFKYGIEKMKFDNVSRKKLLSPSEIKQYQTNAEEAFFEEAKRCKDELSGVGSAVEFIKLFVQLCDDCCRSEISVAQKRSAESRRLYSVLGKNYIMNKSAFEKIIDINTITSINEDNIDWWLDTAISLLQFLSSGTVTGASASPRLYNAIAPMVASYNNHNDSKDGYDTATFALIFGASEISGKGMEINMLSEFSYEISMRYYCLPNVVRSNNKWWIDPFVIKCNDFDSIFFEG